MDNLQALAIVLKLDKVLLIMSKLSTDLRNICNLNSAIINITFWFISFISLQTVTNSKRIAQNS